MIKDEVFFRLLMDEGYKTTFCQLREKNHFVVFMRDGLSSMKNNMVKHCESRTRSGCSEPDSFWR